MGMGTRALAKIGGAVASLATAVFVAAPAWAQDLMGQPTPGGIDLQPAASPLKHQAIWFHNAILLPMCIGISVLVLGLLLWIVIRYNKKSNPVPAKWSHNTVVEVIWTVVPVVILVGISLFSFRLLFAYHDMPTPDLTVKVTGNQWNWAYEYPDQAVPEYISNMLPEDKTTPQLYRLAADEPMVVPVGKTVRLLVTASDVIHAVALPAFGLKTDAVPGRVNETWFKAERTGIFYGQCSELCGVDHAFMPLQINVVTEAEFAAWVVSKGGSMTPKAAPGGTADQAAAGAAPAVGTVGAVVTTPAADGAIPTAQTATTPTAQPASAVAAPTPPAAPAAAAPAAQ